MEIYRYRGRDRQGNLAQGALEADSEDAVAKWMLASGLTPLDIEQEKKAQLTRKASPTPADLLLFTRQLGAMIKAGVPMIQATLSLKNTNQNPRMQGLFESLADDLNRGKELSAALAAHPKAFDDYYINMVRVGEGTGRLEEIFERLFSQLDFERRLKMRVQEVVRYPSFVLVAIGVGLVIAMVYIIPAFSRLYASLQATLPLPTRILIGVSDFVAANGWGLLVLVAVVVAAIFQAKKNKAFLLAWDRLKLKIPVVGSLLRKAAVARFCRSLSMALKSGVPIISALTLCSRVTSNAYVESRVLVMRDSISRGEPLIRGFTLAGILTPLELQMVAVGDETGNVEGMIDQLSVLYQEEIEWESSRLAQTLEPILLVFMASLVLVLILGIFLPMWNLSQAIR